jgi:hypothetical protein
VVEHRLAKARVAGSSPVSRSSLDSQSHPSLQTDFRGLVLRAVNPHKARYPSGKGEVCKTFMRRFDSDPRLQSSDLHSLLYAVVAEACCTGGYVSGQMRPRLFLLTVAGHNVEVDHRFPRNKLNLEIKLLSVNLSGVQVHDPAF